ncbi:hypothetical protein [Bacterioplanes sanyensis]|uniref:hypothetical protein n=1 Tax=Bacterioplanes sanyensis TaxID=1249553 RepID=UPI001E586852|nr:hypothetical protein [Bacterioplanes sanyensis]
MDQDATYFAGPGELWVHNACKVPTIDEIRDALGDDADKYYIAKRSNRLTIIRRNDLPEVPQLDYELDADGNIKIVPKTFNVDFPAKESSRISKGIEPKGADLTALESAREEVNRQIKKADADNDAEKVGQLQQERIRLSEEIGEHVADKHFNREGYDRFKELDEANEQMGNGKQGEFDMAFWDDDGNLVIVEAKGGNSRLGSRQIKHDDNLSGKRAQQGTKEYMDDIIANYRAKLGPDHEVVKELEAVSQLL